MMMMRRNRFASRLKVPILKEDLVAEGSKLPKRIPQYSAESPHRLVGIKLFFFDDVRQKSMSNF
jgi:hypothetical protein